MKLSINRAWKDTLSLVGGKTVILPILAVFPVGFAIHYFQSKAEAMSELELFGIYGVLAPLIVFASVFLLNLACAPYRIVRDELNEFKEKLGLNEPIIRPDINLSEAIALVRVRDNLNSDTEACRYITDLFSTEQVKVWGRESTSHFENMIMGPPRAIEQNRKNYIENAYSSESRSKSPLCNLREYSNWKNNYITHEYVGIDLLADNKSGVWLSQSGLENAMFDLRFSKVELARALEP